MHVKSSGKELAKVLWYYGLIPDANTSEHKIVCPFHKDLNPSMIVNLKDGSYFCFGCQESGDALKFVQTIEKRNGLNDLQSCKKYFEILKSDKCKKLNIRYKEEKQISNKQLYVEAYDYFHGLSKVKWDKKTDNEEIINARKYLQKRGFKPNALNYINAKVTYNSNYGIIFPMLDNGKFKGWVCRTMDKEIEKQRKYLYNKGFRRKDSLIGKYDDCEVLFIVEGFLDMLKFIQHGHKNVVAILGWKISDVQIDKIKNQQNIKYVVSALDNDKYGKKGSKYLKSIFKDKYVRFSYLKNIKDIGETNKETFDKMYSRTMNKIDIKQ